MIARASFLALLVASVLGCSRQESVSETREDVARVRQEGAEHVTETQEASREAVSDAVNRTDQAAVDGATPDAAINNQGDPQELATLGRYQVEVARAEAAHKVAIEQCETRAGEQQRDCKNKADEQLERVKQQAEQRRDSSG